jgi:hypothetical protein
LNSILLGFIELPKVTVEGSPKVTAATNVPASLYKKIKVGQNVIAPWLELLM